MGGAGWLEGKKKNSSLDEFFIPFDAVGLGVKKDTTKVVSFIPLDAVGLRV